jgi:predicted MFS family arabinose efflux permease
MSEPDPRAGAGAGPAPAASLPSAAERSITLALGLAAFVASLNGNVMAPLLPAIGREHGIGADTEGLLLAAPNLAATAGALALGPVSDRAGQRPVTLFGFAIFIAGSFLHALPGLAPLFVARVITGLGGGILFMSASAVIADVVPYERRGRAMGIFSAGIFLAFSGGLLAAALMVDRWGWRSVFLLQGVLALAAAVPLAAWIPRGAAGGTSGVGTYLGFLRPGPVLAVLVSLFLFNGAFFTFVQFTGKWLTGERIVASAAELGPLYFVVGLAGAAGSIWLPRLSDRTGKKKMVLLSSAGTALLMPLVASWTTLTTITLSCLALAVVNAGRLGPYQALLSELVPPAHRGSVMAVRAAAVTAGMGVASSAGGVVYGAGGIRGLAWLCCGVTLLGTLVTLLAVEEPGA